VKVLAPSIAWFGRLVSPMHAKVTTHVLLGAKRHRLPCWKQWRWRATKVASKRRGLNIKKWLQPRKFAPLRSRFSGYSRYADLEPLRGKANVAGEETGKCNLQTVVVRAQASSEGLAEISSGSRSEKLGRGGTDNEIAKPLIVIQRVQIPPDQSRADRSVVSLAIHRATGGCEA
jgi:hypothetical protein